MMNFLYKILDYFNVQGKCIFCKTIVSDSNNPACDKCLSERKTDVVSPPPPKPRSTYEVMKAIRKRDKENKNNDTSDFLNTVMIISVINSEDSSCNSENTHYNDTSPDSSFDCSSDCGSVDCGGCD